MVKAAITKAKVTRKNGAVANKTVAKQWQTAFLMCPLGAPDSEIRTRANELQALVIEPALKPFKLRVTRSDRDLEPGTITRQIMRNIWQARVVIADLTTWNPNVFFELGVAQAWQKAVILLSDQPSNNPFDVQHERTIGLGFAGRPYAGEVQRVRDELMGAIELVLAKDYKPQSVVTDVATALSLASMASTNPVASEVAALSDGLSDLASRISGLEYTLRQNANPSLGSSFGSGVSINSRSWLPATSGAVVTIGASDILKSLGSVRVSDSPFNVTESGEITLSTGPVKLK